MNKLVLRAYTLLEVLVAVAIVLCVIALLIPALQGIRSQSTETKAISFGNWDWP